MFGFGIPIPAKPGIAESPGLNGKQNLAVFRSLDGDLLALLTGTTKYSKAEEFKGRFIQVTLGAPGDSFAGLLQLRLGSVSIKQSQNSCSL